jgi:hypothetical protein
MNQKKLDPSAADLLASANEAFKWKSKLLNIGDEIPDGWKTREEISEYLNLRKSQTNTLLKIAIKNNACEMKSFLSVKEGKSVRKPYYFLLE